MRFDPAALYPCIGTPCAGVSTIVPPPHIGRAASRAHTVHPPPAPSHRDASSSFVGFCAPLGSLQGKFPDARPPLLSGPTSRRCGRLWQHSPPPRRHARRLQRSRVPARVARRAKADQAHRQQRVCARLDPFAAWQTCLECGPCTRFWDVSPMQLWVLGRPCPPLGLACGATLAPDRGFPRAGGPPSRSQLSGETLCAPACSRTRSPPVELGARPPTPTPPLHPPIPPPYPAAALAPPRDLIGATRLLHPYACFVSGSWLSSSETTVARLCFTST